MILLPLQGASSRTISNPGRRFACPGLSTHWAFSPSSDKVERIPSSDKIERYPSSGKVEHNPSSDKIERNPSNDKVQHSPCCLQFYCVSGFIRLMARGTGRR